MKKQAALSMALMAMVTMTACGEEEINSTGEQSNTNEDIANDNNQEDKAALAHEPAEPEHDEVCAFCNMKIYGSGDVMGAFTAQAITASGERVFFDDSGCLLNAERTQEEKYAQTWVRDLDTLAWTTDDDATIVKADIQTPMKYGYAFFADESTAEQYVADNTALNAAITEWDDINAVAYERYQKKMGQNNHESSHSDSSDENSDSGH